MADDLQVKISAEWDAWINGFDRLTDDIEAHAARTFEEAAEVMFSRSQTFAHVITGDMLSTGRVEVDEGRNEVEARVMYGGIPGKSGRIVDYAAIENARGGSHAFLDRAWEATEAQFARALPAAWQAVTESWR